METKREAGNVGSGTTDASGASIPHILFPTDFSERAAAAWPYAVGLAKEGGVELHVLHVVTPAVLGASPESMVTVPPALVDDVLAELQGVVHELAGPVHALGVEKRTDRASVTPPPRSSPTLPTSRSA